MQFSTSALLALFAATGALALPEALHQNAERCEAYHSICPGSTYIGNDDCACHELRLPGQRLFLDQLSDHVIHPKAHQPQTTLVARIETTYDSSPLASRTSL
ncbi:hypothetical protein F4778DRAFT_785300 [Xylariomycetidae sp. FL2044]|nr:hypothetical protein F4778DRAFT_785300 [Xylariomycetidae sp. FL2044]